MQDNYLDNHIKKVSKILLITFWIFNSITYIFTMIVNITQNIKFDETFLTQNLWFVVLIISSILYYKKYYLIAGTSLCGIIVINVSILLSISQSKEQNELYLFSLLLAIGAVTLFFNRVSFIIVCGAIDLLVTVIELNFGSINREKFLYLMFLMNFLMIILFFVTKWGRDLVINSAKKEHKVTEMFMDLQKTMDIINSSNQQLNDSINEFSLSLESLKSNSAGITNMVEKVSEGISGQTNNINNINNTINDANIRIEQLSHISKEVLEVSNKTNDVVADSSLSIKEMKNQMNIINRIVNNSIITVSEFSNSTEKVSEFIDGIKQITEQTNLLAINASIEAAKAGENGKGFAVVANEIRVLADETSNLVKLINIIVQEITNKSTDVVNEVSNGKVATETGEVIVNTVATSFENVQKTFSEIDENISREFEAIEKLNNIFLIIKEQSQSISNIASQNLSSIENMLNSIQKQDDNLKNILDVMKNIKGTSHKLKDVQKIEKEFSLN